MIRDPEPAAWFKHSLSSMEKSVYLFKFCLIFARKFIAMETTTRKDTKKFWLLFFISLIGVAAVWVVIPQLITLTLPFVLTFFVKAMDIM